MSASPVVLVTGATGCLGSLTILELVHRGYKVRGISRSREKSDAWNAAYPQQAPFVEWITITSIVDVEVLDRAAIGVDYIIHAATPFNFDFEFNLEDMLVPSVVAVSLQSSIVLRAPTQTGYTHRTTGQL